MGSIVQTKQVTKTNQINHLAKKQSLTLNDFQVVKIGQGGHNIVRYDQTKEGLFVSKRIPQTTYQAQKENLQRWVQSNAKNSCSVLECIIKDQSFFCSSHVDFKVILEYSDCNLRTLLKTTQNDYQPEQFQYSRKYLNWSNPVEILSLIKFCLQTAEEHHQITKKWPVFHTTNVLYFKKLKQLKFLYIPIIDQQHQNEIFFDPQSQQVINKQSEQTSVFSIGMIVMSFLIKQDCSECYNYQHFQFCQSVFEQKIEKLQAISSKNPLLSQLSTSQIGLTIEDQMIEFALCATSSICNRPNLQQLKKKYFKLLRQISLGCEPLSSSSTNRVQRRQRSILKNKRLLEEVKPFQTKENAISKQRLSDSEDKFELLKQMRKPNQKLIKRKCFKNCEDYNKQNMGIQQYR